MFLIAKKFWRVGKTKNKGRGVFAKKEIARGTVIGDYTGKIIKLVDIDFEEEKKNMYLLYYSDDSGIYPDLKSPGVYLLNHSCSPNSWIYKYNDRTLVFALRNINKGEEITISYLLPPKNICKPCTHKCFCRSKLCRGTMHLTETNYKKWQTFKDKYTESKKEALNTEIQKVLRPLSKYPKSISGSYINKIEKLNFF